MACHFIEGLFHLLENRTGEVGAGAHPREYGNAEHQYQLAENLQGQAQLFDEHFFQSDTSTTKRQRENLLVETRFDEIFFRKVVELFVLKN